MEGAWSFRSISTGPLSSSEQGQLLAISFYHPSLSVAIASRAIGAFFHALAARNSTTFAADDVSPNSSTVRRAT
jgi:hypothetical protein